jgi:hypothetical protein
MTDVPPLVMCTHPDGRPDWPAANALARQAVLGVLEEARDELLSGEELARRCRRRGIHAKVTHRARCELEHEGLIRGRTVMRGRLRARLWDLAR